MTRFFSSNCKGSTATAAAAAAAAESPEGKDTTAATIIPSSTSRWARRPRLRRQCAHEFDPVPQQQPLPVYVEKPYTTPSPACANSDKHQQFRVVSRESGSGYTEAPSSRGASETLSSVAPSPSGPPTHDNVDDDDDDILGDVSDDDDDLSWLDSEIPIHDNVGVDEQPEEVAGSHNNDEFNAKNNRVVVDRRTRARLEPPLELRVEDFECGECIGKGSYSRVFLGTHVVTGTEWALKVVSKRRTFETRENLAHLREEKNIAEKAQGSDFLVRTAGTFQNPKR